MAAFLKQKGVERIVQVFKREQVKRGYGDLSFWI